MEGKDMSEIKELSIRHKQIGSLHFQGLKTTEIAERLGLNIGTVDRVLSNPLCKSYINGLCDRSDNTVIDVRRKIAEGTLFAVDKIVDLIKDDETTASVQLNASKDILDRGGYKPVEKHASMTAAFSADEIMELLK
jgi:hypothetical protein